MMARLFGLRTIDPAALAQRLGEGGIAVFDVNSRESWRRAHVPGARPLDPQSFVADDLQAERTASLVFYCSNPLCRKAPLAARRAKQMGFEDVRVLSAGITGWMAAGLRTEAGQ